MAGGRGGGARRRCEVEEFALDRLDPVAAFLEIDGARIAAVPVFDAPSTDCGGIGGRLGPVGGDAEIAVAELSPQAVYSGEYERLRRTGGHRGFVVVCAGQSPGMGLLNAEKFRAAVRHAGDPCVERGARPRAGRGGASAPGPARLARAGDTRDRPQHGRLARRRRTRGRRAARRHDAAQLMVAIDLRARRRHRLLARKPARAARGAARARPVVFTANSGHELGHLGLDDFVARRPGWDRTAEQGGALWVHYGANIGAAGGSLSLVSPDAELREHGGAELVHVGQPHTLAPKELVPSGETRDIHRAGGRYLTLVGTNPLFHLPQDRWPDGGRSRCHRRAPPRPPRARAACCGLIARPRGRTENQRQGLEEANMAEQEWSLRGEYMESCNCDYLCPCIYTNPQGPATQRAVHRGDGVPHR